MAHVAATTGPATHPRPDSSLPRMGKKFLSFFKPFSTQRISSPEDLAQHGRLCTLTREQKPSDWLLQKGEHAWRCQTRAVAAINSPEVLTRLAIAGSGILAAGQMFTDSSVDKGALVRVLPDWHLEKVSIWAVYPGRRLLPSRTRVFLDMLEAWLRPGA